MLIATDRVYTSGDRNDATFMEVTLKTNHAHNIWHHFDACQYSGCFFLLR